MDQELDRRLQAIFAEYPQRYGAPRIAKTLSQEGHMCSENRIARRRRVLHWRAIQAKKFNVTTDSHHSRPVAPDLLKQDFDATTPNQKWATDLTSVWTDEGWRHLAVELDLYSRAIVGWSINQRMTQQLVCDALTMGLFRQHFHKGTILHSDRGSQNCSKRYQRLIKINSLRGRIGHTANGYDNAVRESFLHTLKVELVHRERSSTRREAQSSLFQYIETYDNR